MLQFARCVRYAGWLCAGMFLACGGALAQKPLPIKAPAWLDRSIKIEQKEYTFDLLLPELARVIGRSILSDGQPQEASVKEGYSGTVREVLDKVADRFDFTWTVSSRNTILLNKRFHNEQELPQVQLPEMQRMGKDFLAVFSRLQFDHNIIHDRFLHHQVYDSLSPQQKEALWNGARLTWQDLTPEQAEFTRQAVYQNAVSVLYNDLDKFSQELTSIPAGSLYTEVRQMGPRSGPTVPVYTVCFEYRNATGYLLQPEIALERLTAPK